MDISESGVKLLHSNGRKQLVMAEVPDAGVLEMSDFDTKFTEDADLQVLLRQWKTPETPGSLDNRVAASYQQSMGSATQPDSVLNPQRGSEVVAMKFCNTCQEEFADRFSFCPVDGTPLSVAPTPVINEPTPTVQASAPAADRIETVTAAPAFSAASAAPSYAAARAVENIGEFHLTILEDRGLAARLADELGGVAHNYQLTWPEFKRDPFGFTKRSIQGYGSMVGKFFGSRDVVIAASISILAMAALVSAIYFLDRTQNAGGGPSRRIMLIVAVLGFCGLLAIFGSWLSRDRGAAVMGARPSDSRNVLSGIISAFALLFLVVGGAFFWDMHQRAKAATQTPEEQLELTQMITDIPADQPTPDEGNAGMAKGSGGGSKTEKIKPGGGGGGGREEKTDASNGKLPQTSLTTPQVVAPDPHPPVIKNPALPMPATLDADPVLFPPDTRNLQYGDPKSKSTTASSGPGTGNGIGSGTGGGVGRGSGGGYGPGEGGNTGGGARHEGGGGAGGGGGGTDYSRVFNSKDVTSKARVLEKPEPQYT